MAKDCFPIHRSAWKRNSRKFAVANGSSTYRQAPAYGLCYPPSWSKRSDLAPFVAPLCIKGLRLVTVQLPEKCSPNKAASTIPVPSSRAGAFGSGLYIVTSTGFSSLNHLTVPWGMYRGSYTPFWLPAACCLAARPHPPASAVSVGASLTDAGASACC